MWLFYLLVFLVFFLYLLCYRVDHGKLAYIIIIFGIFGILMMFRGPTVGNDTDTYTDLFKLVSKTSDLEFLFRNTRYERGYIYLNKILSLIFNHPQILFIVTGAFVAFSFGRFIYKYSENLWLSALMFLTLQFFDLSLSGVRQIVAISVLLFAYDYLLTRKFWKFLLLVLLSSTIHTSTILFLLFYPLTAKKRGASFYLASIIIAVGIYAGFNAIILPIAGKIFPQYLKYLEGEGVSYSSSPKLASFLMMSMWFILFMCAKIFGRELPQNILDDYYDVDNTIPSPAWEDQSPDTDVDTAPYTQKDSLWTSLRANHVHEIAVWMGIIMLFLALQGTILNRFKYIFSVPMLVYYPNKLMTMDSVSRRIITAISCVVFVLYSVIIYTYRPEWQSTYPYTFFWQKTFLEGLY